jgi:DNA-binding NarL/FixJ family response regulator
MEDQIRVLVATPHPLLLFGIRTALAAAPDIDLVAEAHAAPTAVNLCDQFAPDVLVFAGHVLDEGTFLSLARLYQQQVKTVLVSTHADDPAVRRPDLQVCMAGYCCMSRWITCCMPFALSRTVADGIARRLLKSCTPSRTTWTYTGMT